MLAEKKRSDESVAELEATLPAQARSTRLPDDQLIAATKAALNRGDAGLPASASVTNVSVAMRNFDSMSSSVPGWPTANETVVMRLDGPGQAEPVRVLVAVSRTGNVGRVAVVKPEQLRRAYGFVRTMAAYTLFNDLMASDTEVPRRGCIRYFQLQAGAAAEPVAEIQGAFEKPPLADSASIARAHSAYAAYRAKANDLSGDEGTLTRQTLERLGSNPRIEFIYRDVDATLNSAAEYDVIRLGDAGHTYAMLLVDESGETQLAPIPLCLEGDTACAKYYGWP